MEQKSNKSSDTVSDIEIIKKIVSEKENDELVKEKLYRILYEASSADEINMDTDLIDECVKAIDLIEGNEEHIPEEKIKAMRQNVDRQYREWRNSQRKIVTRKRIVQIAACFILIFFMSSVVADAIGYNLIQSMVKWGKDTFNLSSPNQPSEQNSNPNISQRETYNSVEEAMKDIPSKPLLPKWVPDRFTFKYAEKYVRTENTKILLYYQDGNNKSLVFDFTIYHEAYNATTDINFEKDENLVKAFEKNNIKH